MLSKFDNKSAQKFIIFSRKANFERSLFYKIIPTLFFLFAFNLLVGIDIDLKNPIYKNGVLTTNQGGVITAPNFRIQARNVIYTGADGQSLLKAEKDIILEIGDSIFVGRRLEYDFNTRTGTLYDGRTEVEPWYLGGEKISLCSDGSYTIHNGFATTSENYKMDWKLETSNACLKQHRFLTAENVKFRFIALPIFWMPKIHLDLNSLFDPPVRLNFKVGGIRGSKAGIIYTLYSANHWRTNLRLDYRIKSGFGGGSETYYCSPCKCTSFKSINYISEDRTRFDHHKRTRYRIEGNYRTQLNYGKTTIDGSWDKLSDYEMASDYDDKDLYLELAKPTQLYIRHQERDWIGSLFTRVRVNQFESLKQELPTLTGKYRPFEIGKTGIIAGGKFKASYLEFEYTNHNDPSMSDYNSPRYEIVQSFWRPIQLRNFTLTPEIGTVGIYYGNSAKQADRWMVIGLFDVDLHTDIHRFYGRFKHVLTPYIRYQYYTDPTTSPSDHFIFDIEDGWYRLNTLRFGLLNNLYMKSTPCRIYRAFYLDLYSYAFFDTDTIPQTIPKIYLRTVSNFTKRLRYTHLFVWDFENDVVDQFNSLFEWTVSNDLAVSLEYRHRSKYDWRKVNRMNFIIDSYRTIEELEHSLLSDRRDTFLFHFYWQIHPSWAFMFESRNGWNRRTEPGYKEFQFSLIGTFRSSWNVKMSYKHREHDDRFSINFSVGMKRPEAGYNNCRIPCLEF